MKYIDMLLGWDVLNIYLFVVAYLIKFNLTHFLIFFFAGHFLIILYGLFEAIKKDNARNKGCRPQ